VNVEVLVGDDQDWEGRGLVGSEIIAFKHFNIHVNISLRWVREVRNETYLKIEPMN
jgi:hypothetical protein